MRSWGSPVVTESAPPSPSMPAASVVEASSSTHIDNEKTTKKKRKGDKGGTGAKANSKRPKEDVNSLAVEAEPAAKKRKRSSSPAATMTEISDKTVKRLRKSASKVAEKSLSLSLGDWLKQVGEGKKEQLDASEVNRAAKVNYEGGKWVLSF